MKTIIFNIILTAVLSFSTISVFAGDTKGKKESSKKNLNTVSTYISNVKEAGLELESWMTSLVEFNSKSEIFVEAPLEMEAWMMNDFNTDIDTDILQEEELVLEGWMLNDFNVNNNTENFQDEELILENWMLESFESKSQGISIDKELEFEAWMLVIL